MPNAIQNTVDLYHLEAQNQKSIVDERNFLDITETNLSSFSVREFGVEMSVSDQDKEDEEAEFAGDVVDEGIEHDIMMILSRRVSKIRAYNIEKKHIQNNPSNMKSLILKT